MIYEPFHEIPNTMNTESIQMPMKNTSTPQKTKKKVITYRHLK